MLHEKTTEKIIGAAMEVLNSLGHGFNEKPYENALCVEFKIQDIPFEQQYRHPIWYKDIKVGEYIPDLLVDRKIIVDTKSIEKITKHEEGQMLNYLRVTGLQVGLIINFMRPKLEWKRVII